MLNRFRTAGLLSLAFVALACAQQSLRLQTTADEVLGQRDFNSLDPNYPDGQPRANNVALSNAAGVAVADDGRIYLSDPDNNRILSWPSVRVMRNGSPADFVLGQPDFVSGEPNNGGVSAHSLYLPQGLCVDAAGNLWVADAFNNRVLKFNRPLRDVTPKDADLVIGQPDMFSNDANLGGGYQEQNVASAQSLCFCGGIAVHGRDVYIADSGNSRIVHYFDPRENLPTADRVWGQHGSFTCRGKNNVDCVDGEFPTAETLFNPIGVAVDPSGDLWVADWQNHRVLRYADPLHGDLAAEQVIGQPDFVSSDPDNGGRSAGLEFPIGVAVDRYGTLYVADTGNNRVLVFSQPHDSSLAIDVFGQLGNLDRDQINHGLGPFDADADALFGPTGVAADRFGNLYVVDTTNQRLLRYQIGVGDDPRRKRPSPRLTGW